MRDRAVICFTRVPVPGRTKTRLMPLLTGEQCAGLHRAFLRDLSRTFARVEADLYVAYTPDTGWEGLRDLFPAASGFFPQEGTELGERMERALGRVLELGHRACVLVGADLPLLTAAHLEGGFSALEGADVTLGPTSDGGYYLVGLKRPCPPLFSGQTYGESTVYQRAVLALEQAGVSFAPAPPCDDVDTPEDLAALRSALRHSGSHTARYLRQIISKEGL